MVDIRIVRFHLGQLIGDACQNLFLEIVIFNHSDDDICIEVANLRFLFIELTKKVLSLQSYFSI